MCLVDTSARDGRRGRGGEGGDGEPDRGPETGETDRRPGCGGYPTRVGNISVPDGGRTLDLVHTHVCSEMRLLMPLKSVCDC